MTNGHTHSHTHRVSQPSTGDVENKHPLVSEQERNEDRDWRQRRKRVLSSVKYEKKKLP